MDKVDRLIIASLHRIYLPFSRFALFLIFFWFGILKVFDLSPASPMVLALLAQTLPWIEPALFLTLFGIFEVILGIAFVIPGLERAAIPLLLVHMATTIMPLVLLPALVWHEPFVPTMEGQYIIKNILIIALAMGIAAHLRPINLRRT